VKHTYVPLIPWKDGERIALQNLSASSRTDVRPLLILGPPQYVGKKATKSTPFVIPEDVFAAKVRAAWGEGEFYLDASALSDSDHTHPLTGIASSARKIGLKLIPATRLNASVAYRSAVSGICATDKRGVGLRVDLQEFTSASSWAPQWPHPLKQTDIFADFAGNVGTVFSLGSAVDHAFQHLYNSVEWRSVTSIGTSMPDTFIGLGAGLHNIPRAEWKLWTHLNKVELPYRLDYGDYATVPITMAPEGIAWGYPINVRYTLEHEFLICRGVRTTGAKGVDMAPQLVGHAKQIASYAKRHPLAHCWGDGRIDRIAAGAEGPSGLPAWVQIGVNRHIELVRSTLP
jgi:hypothetical protein